MDVLPILDGAAPRVYSVYSVENSEVEHGTFFSFSYGTFYRLDGVTRVFGNSVTNSDLRICVVYFLQIET